MARFYKKGFSLSFSSTEISEITFQKPWSSGTRQCHEFEFQPQWIIFIFVRCKIALTYEKTKNKRKRGRGWSIFKTFSASFSSSICLVMLPDTLYYYLPKEQLP